MATEIKGVKWNTVDYEGSILNKDLDGLVGIEECTDYSLRDNTTAKKSKKRNSTHKTLDTSNTKKKKKVKHKSKTQSKKTGIVSDDFTLSKHGSTTDVAIAAIATEPSEIPLRNDDSELFLEWNSFGLPQSILQAIKDQGFQSPTEIQRLTLAPAILGRRDILGAAETGSGKTLAFGLPILTGILKIKEKMQTQNSDECNINHKPLYALILTPTRELAVQVKNHLILTAKHTGIHVAVILGGMAAVKQERILSKGPEIVVATPGRLWELIQEGNQHLSQIDDIRFLAIDETDRMLEKGHFSELHDLLERINLDEEKRKQRQNFVFSATLTLTHELPRHLAMKKIIKGRKSKKIFSMTSKQKLNKIIDILGVTNPKIVDVTQKTGTAESLTESRITCAAEEKDYYVYYFLQKHPGRTLIFCNSIGCVKRLTTLLSLLECNALALHASMAQRQRLKNLERFRDNEFGILIATDVAARGLDIPCVEHVLHYQTPRTSESYVHRSGRTARASRQGITILLVEPSELKNYLQMCRTLGRSHDLPFFPVESNMLNAVRQRVTLARHLDKLELMVRKTKSENGWLHKAAEEMDILLDENMESKFDMAEAQKHKKAAEFKRKQLAQLVAKPLFPKGFSGKYPFSTAVGNNASNLSPNITETAIDVLQNSMKNSKNIFRRKKLLFQKRKQ